MLRVHQQLDAESGSGILDHVKISELHQKSKLGSGSAVSCLGTEDLFCFHNQSEWKGSRDYLSIKVERIKRLCQDLQASPGVEPRAFNDISQPPNFLINSLIHGDEKREYLLLANYLQLIPQKRANHKFMMPLLHNSIEAHVLSATGHRAASASVG